MVNGSPQATYNLPEPNTPEDYNTSANHSAMTGFPTTPKYATRILYF